MSLEDFETIVSRLGPFDGASLHNGGEPTLNPALPEMVALLARSGQAKTIRIVSNGLARPLSCYERLFEAGLNALEISVDTFSPELAFRIRKGTDVEELKRKLRDLRTIFPGLVTRTTVSRLNLGEVLETFKLLLSLGISKLCVQPFESRTPDENVLSLRERLDFAATLEQFSKESGIPVDRQFLPLRTRRAAASLSSLPTSRWTGG
jgi:MoaA/NifB/PqqE/SkfB family radical SAM enzyme